MKLFSVDDHIIEPADVWSKRLPAKYRDAAPHVIEEDKREVWVYEDQRGFTMGLNAVVGRPREEWTQEPARFSDMRPGCYDPVERAKDLLSEDITSSLSFPTLPRFGGALFPSFKDKALADLCVKAWNDYLFEEWCAAAPQMFVPMVIVQLWDPKAAAVEIERNVARGARAVAMPEETSHLGTLPSYYESYWDPIWAACQEADIAVCMHIGSSGWKAYVPPGASETLPIALGFVPTITHAMGMAFGPVPRRFPKIKLVYSEGGIGWVPIALERADSRYELHHSWSGDDDLLPSEVYRRNMWFCMMPDEHYGLEQRERIGLDRIFWETDYPHANCPWPGTQDFVEDFFQGVPRDEVAMIAHGNAEKVFNWRCPEPDEVVL
jgi:predicted TIM-barrel fold metal-dependent hydrolase